MATSVTGKATEFIQFTRASNATVTDSDGKVKWAPHNLLLASESLDASNWTKTALTVTANAAAAPNGTTTADKLIPSATSNYHNLYQGSITSGVGYSISVYAKAAGYNFLYVANSSTTANAIFDLSTGAVSSTGAGATSAIASVGNGWYLCTVTFTSTTTNAIEFGVSSTSTWGVYTGDGTSGVLLWGAALYRSDLGGMQANTSAYPMYNPTTPKNLLGYTEDFSNAAWTKAGATVTTNSVLAPNGLQTADKIVESAGGTQHVVTYNTNFTGVLTFSISVKAAGRNYCCINDGNSGVLGRFVVDLTNGTVTQNTSSLPYTITPQANDFYRISVTGSFNTSQIRVGPNDTGTIASNYFNSYTGDGTSGIYLWGAQLSDSASLDTYSPVYGAAVTSAAYYGPRRDFDPVSLACKGLLVEEQRTNLLLQSAAPNVSPWTTGANTVVTAASGTSPDGTLTACRLNMTAASGTYLRQSPTLTVGQVYTFSCYAKAYGSDCQFTLGNSTGVSSALNATSSWQRYSYTFTAVSADYVNIDDISATTDLLIWGAQLEAASFATSYIPTGAATATRLADVASVSTQAFPYSATEGALVVSATTISTVSTSGRYAGLVTSNLRAVDLYGSGTQYVNFKESDGQATAFGTWQQSSKIGAIYKADDYAFVANGTTVVTDTSTSGLTAVNQLNIGHYFSGSQLNGHIRQITYLPRRISNTELQTRTQ